MVLDDINVTFDQGSGPVDMGTETCEDGDTADWVPFLQPGCGDFAKVWPRLYALDPCVDDATPQWAFVDDGEVVPGTGGTLGVTWTYGPGAYVFNVTGGVVGGYEHVQNEIWSPAIALPGGDYLGHRLAFSIWPHLPVDQGVFWYWAVAFSADGVEWGSWEDRSFVYYGTDRYERKDYVLSDLVPADAAYARIRLGAWDAGWIWGYFGDDPTPAPYFDDVSYKVHTLDGPQISARSLDLAQDGFAPLLDPADPAAAAVPFDSANLAGSGAAVPGDSIVISTDYLMLDAELSDRPLLHYALFRNPEFDPWRTAGLPDEGSVHGDTVFTASGLPVPDRWSFDLPDEGFLFPGDVLHYYLTAESVAPGFAGVSIMPADTSGFGSGPTLGAYDEIFTVRALPGVYDVSTMAHDDKLLWLDDPDPDAVAAWGGAIARLAVTGRPMYTGDVFVANHSYGCGLGVRVSPEVLAGYSAVIYDAGDERSDLLMDEDARIRTADIDLLEDWLAGGDRGLAVFGDDVIADLTDHGADGVLFATNVLGVDFTGDDVAPLLGGLHSPGAAVNDPPPTGFLSHAWQLHGWCPDPNDFDALGPVPGADIAALWLDSGGSPFAAPLAACIRRPGDGFRDRFTWPFGLASVAGADAELDRALILLDLCAHFDGLVPVSNEGTEPPPPAGRLAVRCVPNPFNPATAVEYEIVRPGQVTVQVHDLRGALVRTLLDERRPAGRGTVRWDGRDEDGRAAGSGAYLVRVRTDGGEVATRGLLLR